MSVRVLTKAFTHSRATLAARLVLLALADGAQDDGVTWIDQAVIAEKALVSEQSVRRCLRELEGLGEVETRKAQRGRRRINVYRVLMPDLAEIDYERFPFDLVEPFSTTAQIARSSDGDDRANPAATTAQIARSHARASNQGSKSFNRKLNRNGVANATPADSPPKLARIDGRDVAFDALRDACSIEEDDPHGARETAAALNGKDGIRAMFWTEFAKWAEEQGHPERVGEAREEPERFERALAAVVARKAARYRRRFPGADVTPTALRKWWLRLDNTRIDRSRLSSEDIVRIDELAEREGISFEDALDRLAGAVA